LLAAALAVRVVIWLALEPVGLFGDERDYNALAVGLVLRHEYASQPGVPTSLRPPLYPFFLAGVYSLAGVENFPAVRLAQLGISLATALVLYRLGAAAYDRRVGLVQCGLYLFYPSLLGFNNLLYAEVLFIFWLCAACCCLVLALRRAAPGWLVAGGVLLGLAALTRSVAWLLPVLLGPFLLFAWPGGWGRRARVVLLFVVPFAATLAPWAVRNTRLEKTFVAVDTMSGRNFMMGNYEYTPLFRAWDAISMTGEQDWFAVLVRSDPAALQTTQGQRDKLALRYGLRYALDHPAETARRDAVKFFNFWGLERELVGGAARGFFGGLPAAVVWLLALAVFASYAAVFLLGVLGAFLFPPPDRRVHALLLLVILFVCAAHTASFGHSRYHLPVMPLVMAYSASALVRLREVWAQRRRPRFWLAAGVCALFVAAWAAEVGVVYTDRFIGVLGGAS
jgi:4-amino-4-deoxy-L-arabinose transferase-like glycosyltransferase